MYKLELRAFLYKEQYCISFLMATRQKLFDLKDGKVLYIVEKRAFYTTPIAEENHSPQKTKTFGKNTPT
jgi:hypothetical protein